jgi:intracellular sulfur oxidation DsrE/DsrF family protein
MGEPVLGTIGASRTHRKKERNVKYVQECLPDLAKAIDEEFGPGTADKTRPLSHTRNIRFLFQVNQLYKDPAQTQPFAVENILNTLSDFENHGMVEQDYDLVAIVHAEGWPLILDNNATERHQTANPFQQDMEDLLRRNIHVFFCLNTARKKTVRTSQVVSGVRFVTSGVTAIADFQAEGYRYIQP